MKERIERYDRKLAKREMRYLEWAARRAQKRLIDRRSAQIEEYTPYLAAPSNWLPLVEARIRDSVLPEEYEGEFSTEWLTEDAAFAAIAFFRHGADLLPTEPHLYATNSGDLVAEFETADGSMTSVVSDQETILFAVPTIAPDSPIHTVIRRGSNTFREELRSVTKQLTSGRHGKMDPAQ
ncbi:hypothetical protein ABUE29_25950 [Mesorhizobium sp. ZMM04-4]